MERASRILIKVGMIVSIVYAAIMLFSSPFMIVMGVSSHIHDMIVDGVSNGEIYSDLSPEQAAIVVQATLLSLGIMFIIFGLVGLIDAIIASKTLREPSKNRYIACIILGALSTELTLVGGILGLISLSRKNRKQDYIDQNE